MMVRGPTRKRTRRFSCVDPMNQEARQAVAVGNVKRVKELLLIGLSPNEADCNGWTLLHLASSRGRERVLRELLEHQGSPCARDGIGGFTCLHYAAMHGRTRLAQLLLEYDKDNKYDLVNSPSSDGWTPLHVAAHYGRESFVRMLLQQGARVDALSTKGTSPLQLAIIREKVPCVKLLLAYASDIDIQSGFPLRYTILKGNMFLARLLLLNGASPNLGRSEDGQTPLHLSAMKDDTACCVLLCRFGADSHAVNDDGKTPLEMYKSLNEGDTGASLSVLTVPSRTPRTLQDHCRLVIRHRLGQKGLHHINLLPIANIVKDYVRYKDHY
ncbi:ankyrin repeat and SOCS box protein 7 [Strongylocentrotus purpuratus]|uniref:SOCS box domain-containing protein n=1 Tax=Strongylocentrotus purpuratus TaxID=7668 RepID=A0A7M7RHA1_STRPU|nr:ankyrin repeat and SOCS box protein 7 [Strongylocentrotus purpuratus]|eukprot:XP_795910.1 PREDICTED: ankyrin repeat and SOCS box protein 7 [Strongylocentrotus purpuratus]